MSIGESTIFNINVRTVFFALCVRPRGQVLVVGCTVCLRDGANDNYVLYAMQKGTAVRLCMQARRRTVLEYLYVYSSRDVPFGVWHGYPARSDSAGIFSTGI